MQIACTWAPTSSWVEGEQGQRSAKNALDEAGARRRAATRTVTARRSTSAARRSEQRANTCKSAAEVYKLYLASFREDARTPYDIRAVTTWRRSSLTDFKQYEDAADHYIKVAKADPKGKYQKTVGPQRRRGGEPAGASRRKWGRSPAAVGASAEAARHPARRNRRSSSRCHHDQYVAILPKEKDGEPMRFTAAQIALRVRALPRGDQALRDRLTKEIPETQAGARRGPSHPRLLRRPRRPEQADFKGAELSIARTSCARFRSEEIRRRPSCAVRCSKRAMA